MSWIQTLSVVALLSAALAVPASAQPSGRSTSADPNQKVCETQTQTGSRVAQKKICATRAEWAARKAADRQTVEDIQRGGNMPCIPDAKPGGAVTPC